MQVTVLAVVTGVVAEVGSVALEHSTLELMMSRQKMAVPHSSMGGQGLLEALQREICERYKCCVFLWLCGLAEPQGENSRAKFNKK